MKFSSNILALLAAAQAAMAATACNADNCARAVTGSFRPLTTSRFADCQSFLACTVTPAVSTSTVTATVTAAPVNNKRDDGAPPAKRLQTPTGSAVTKCASSVPAYASPCSGTARYSSVCSCFGASKTTTTLPASTVTTTTTATVTPVCSNKGFQWAYYQVGNDPEGYDYEPSAFKTVTPSATGVTNYINVMQDQAIYGQSSLNTVAFILNHRGYIYAPETGTYSLTGSNIDDITEMWLGPIAYSGWSRDNGQQTLASRQGRNGAGTFQIDLVAGNYYPFRLVYRNFAGQLSLNYAITAPDGLTIVSSDPKTPTYSPYAVQYSCDGIAAPPFPPFGQET